MTFGDRLRAARKAKKLTQKELASIINAAHNSISNWENDQNKPDPDTIQTLCWALDVQPNYFFLDEVPSVNSTDSVSSSDVENYNVIRIAARDGSYQERRLTDQQLAALQAILDQMPDATDDL